MKRFSIKHANRLYADKQYDELFAYASDFAEKKTDAKTFLGLCHACGYGVEQNRQRALELLREATDRGSDLGALHYYQLVAEISLVDDERFYALIRLGDIYREGAGVPKQTHQAYDMYTRAVEIGRNSATTFLSHPLFYIGYHHYCEDCQSGYIKAFSFFEEAFKQHATWEHGEVYSLCCYFLGLCYFVGRGVEQDFAKAAEYWECDTAPPYNAASQVSRAVMYEKGIPPYEKNIFQADRLYGLNLIEQGALARLCFGTEQVARARATQIHMGIRDILIKESEKRELLKKEIMLESQSMQLDNNIAEIALKSNVTKEHTKKLAETIKVSDIAKKYRGN